MPMKKGAYPENWSEISTRIKEQAGWKCERCGVAHGAEITRSSVDPARYIVMKEDSCFYYPNGEIIRMSEIPDEFDISHYTRVVISVHHIGVDHPDGTPGDPRDKMDCRDENLIALCSRCHLLADLPINIPARKQTRFRKKIARIAATGQKLLFDE